MNELEKFSIKELIDELGSRERVKRIDVNHYEMVDRSVLGPAVILTYRYPEEEEENQ